MKEYFEIKALKDRSGIGIEYWENEFAATDSTGITLYDKYKISIMLSDGMLVVYRDKATRTERGDILVFRPDEPHSARIIDGGVYKFLNIFVPTDFFASLSFDSRKLTDFLEHREGENCIRPKDKKTAVMALELADLLREQGSTAEAFSKLFELLCLLSGEYHSRSGKELKSNMPKAVERALNFMAENYAEKLSLAQIAENSYCSVTYLSKIFKENMGCTVYEHLTSYRILCAGKMLKEGKTVADTCFECGFGDSSHFIKIFKSINGITPFEYKKRAEGETPLAL